MQYLSTRDSALRVSAQEAIVRGLAPQSGLFVPETFPQADLDAWKNLSYPELAEKVLAGFLTDYSADFLHTATASTYGAAFGGKAGETVKVRDGLYSLELWHGPTCAFKDYALQLMPKLLVEAKKMLGRTETTRILVATSGDTGKAALAGYADLDGIEIEVFYPNDGTSEIQHLQMATQKGENVQVYAVQGNFDDAQTGGKKGFADAARVTGPDLMRELLKESGTKHYRHYFYGSTQETLDILREKITEKYPGAVIAGMYSPPFRSLTADEDAEIVEKINAAKPDFVWVGLGAPKQERWMAAHENRVQALMLGVGAAFDYEAGNIRRAPAWMQRCNLEWLYRLMQDPKRLFKRYFVTNTKFLWWSWRH